MENYNPAQLSRFEPLGEALESIAWVKSLKAPYIPNRHEFVGLLVAAAYEEVAKIAVKQPTKVIRRSFLRTIVAKNYSKLLELSRQGRLYSDPSLVSGTLISAWKRFYGELKLLEQQWGRRATRAEQDDLEAEIIATWPDPRHRPPIGFSRGIGSTFHLYEWGENDRAAFEQADCDLSDEDAATYLERYESTGNRKLIWDALAPDLPLTPRLEADTAETIRQHLAENPRTIELACLSWGTGVENEHTIIMFAPFGPLSRAEKDLVVQVLTTAPAYRDDLYLVALKAATIPAHIPGE